MPRSWHYCPVFSSSEWSQKAPTTVAGWIALDELYPTSYHRQAADGLPRRHRGKTACLGKIGRFSQTYGHLGLDHAERGQRRCGRDSAHGGQIHRYSCTVQGCPDCSDHTGYILVINHPLLAQLGSDMSPYVFLSFWRCPKHPNIPPFHLGTPIT